MKRLALALFFAAAAPATAETEFTVQTRWVMGTALRIHLPSEHADAESLFAACFETAEHWDNLLSPWQDEAPLTRLSRAAGKWVDLPSEVLGYLERAAVDSRRTAGIFDITLMRAGSQKIDLDHERSRARLPAGVGPLDPGGDGKGVALDAMAGLLVASGVDDALVDFGGSSFLARGLGPEGEPWRVALTGPDGELLGMLRLEDTAASITSTVQRRQKNDGTVVERFHLVDLRTRAAVRARRTAVVLSRSATEAEVLSTMVAIEGKVGMDGFPGCTIGLFTGKPDEPVVRGDFKKFFQARIRRSESPR